MVSRPHPQYFLAVTVARGEVGPGTEMAAGGACGMQTTPTPGLQCFLSVTVARGGVMSGLAQSVADDSSRVLVSVDGWMEFSSSQPGLA